ncbi:protease B nonderepressible form [Vermiconidia calcicola]|uniref:Protease B nonderepressible form n=1 Tax=Vermiconidia calcicola TaxID=1690605 RepID=A0ACC3NJX8_9PEZI|nr:protease B nonderepressible form [Vermiconidia calcicola]
MIRRPKTGERTEVGTLQVEKATEAEELSLGGFLTVIGEDDHPSKTLFSFPSRHHPLPGLSPATFTASFQQPTGLHPKFEIKLPRQQLRPPSDTCGLHAYWTLPSALFIDRYQLSDPLFLASQNLAALHSLSGEQDLEAPDWAIERWGSAALSELAAPPSSPSGSGTDKSDWIITIPTHLRYLAGPQKPTHTSGHASIDVPWPIVFWACEAEEGLGLSNNPFDRVDLGYDGLFGPQTTFYHIPPGSEVNTTVEEVQVPVLDSEKAEWVQAGTLIAVVAGFAWICWQLLRATSGQNFEAQEQKRK